MNKIFNRLTIVSLLLLLTVGIIEPAVAGPGGKIAAALFQTLWGKILLFFLVILFLPLILYALIREYLAQRRTLKDLSQLALVNNLFDWVNLQERIIECFYSVHAAWHNENITEASEWMTNWYSKNQQIVYLDAWAKKGLINHCQIKKINHIRPLFLAYRGDDKQAEGSRIVLSIAAYMEDYLAKRETGEIVEGKKGFQEVETVWTFKIQQGQWVVANIEEDMLSLEYAQLANELPGYVKGYEQVYKGRLF
jgi:hypothetical protein